ncbi:MAG TPA: hypothetical protein VFN30_00015 [Chitinophagaceae bacterium]|nr:hypothetical protein [Chitinophagaceae bacterium]
MSCRCVSWGCGTRRIRRYKAYGLPNLGNIRVVLTEEQKTDAYPAANGFLNSRTYDANKPKAFVNWIFLDEQFKYYDGGVEQVEASNVFKTHSIPNVSINKNGYLYVYVSNETPDIDVPAPPNELCKGRRGSLIICR